ncbi:MAG: o-succinylbenzoate synthase, partial [Bacteroidetes bacterium]|nr:o-succinylbenzoate synthase [Bacteroidota bacterium]MBU1800112.1 o-succinylbenzoate synthase [Bacteroidota bacterium]
LIEKIELRHVKMELITPFETSMGVELDEEHIIIAVYSEGIIGWGECVAEETPYYSSETVKTAWHILKDFLIPVILNKNINSIDEVIQLWNRIRGHRMAKAGLESALWDLFAKSKNISLSKLLGGTKNSIEVGVSIGIQETPQILIDKVKQFLSDGYGRIKIKIAPGRDISYVKALRDELPNIRLQVDANSAYTLGNVNILTAFDSYNLELIEQPLAYDDIYEHSILAKKLKTPLCLDESIHSLGDTKAAVELGSCKIINIKPGRVGGYTESKKIHDYCQSNNIPVWHGGMLESGIGRAGNIALASLPNFILPGDISASKKYYKHDIIDPSFDINKDSTMNVPKGPGIGVEVIQSQLDVITIYKEIFN